MGDNPDVSSDPPGSESTTRKQRRERTRGVRSTVPHGRGQKSADGKESAKGEGANASDHAPQADAARELAAAADDVARLPVLHVAGLLDQEESEVAKPRLLGVHSKRQAGWRSACVMQGSKR